MALFDEPRREKPKAHVIGEDLSTLSLAELDERVAVLEAEIARLKQAHAEKSASHAAASAFFKR